MKQAHKNILLIFITLFAFLSCDTPENTGSDQPFIVATTGMVADLVKNIAGDSVYVESLMGPGVDPHLYKASQSDIGKLAEADIIFYNGLHLEGKLTDIFEKMARTQNVIPVSRGITQSALIPLAENGTLNDPHIWFDVSLWKQTIGVVETELAETYPNKAEYFRSRAQAYRDSLTIMHKWVGEKIQEIPKTQRILITAHDAFSYFGRAYGINVRGLQGISTVAEYGVNDVSRMVNLIIDNNIKAIFIETSVPDRSINAVIAGCKAKGHDVKIGGSLYSDAMGAPGTREGTYIGMIKSNVLTMVTNLK